MPGFRLCSICYNSSELFTCLFSCLSSLGFTWTITAGNSARKETTNRWSAGHQERSRRRWRGRLGRGWPNLIPNRPARCRKWWIEWLRNTPLMHKKGCKNTLWITYKLVGCICIMEFPLFLMFWICAHTPYLHLYWWLDVEMLLSWFDYLGSASRSVYIREWCLSTKRIQLCLFFPTEQ
jgi:hypothetical protein